MVYAWQILPSPRPLLFWLGADAVCAAALTLLALAQLALWRRPAPPWRLGIAALAGGWVALAADLRVYRAYNDLKNFQSCGSPDDCATITRMISSATLWAGVTGFALVAGSLVAVVGAIALSQRAHGSDDAAVDQPGRWLALIVADLPASVGALTLTQGIFDWIEFAPLADPLRAGDAIGQIPLIGAIITTIAGAALFGFGLALVLRSAGALPAHWKPEPRERVA